MIDLEEFPVTDRIEFLRERMLQAPVPLALDPHPGADLVVHSRVADLGCVHLLSTKAQGGDVVRTDRLTRDDARPSLMVTVIDHGTTTVVRGDLATTLHSGDIGLYVTTDPYRLRFTDGARRHTYQLPLDELGLPGHLIRNQLHSAIRPDQATTAAVSAFLRSTARNAPRAQEPEQSALEKPILELIRLLLTRVVTDTPVGREAAAVSLATRIEEHVKTRLGDPELSVRSIAAAFSISERYVYTILARRGIDLGDMIRRHRLERAATLLVDPQWGLSTVSDIAHRCGFADHAHFSRSFRAQFGVSPSEWRRGARSQDQ
ncbi:helix-turn-helix domain-containing protein [Dactylosporangium sp. CA-092794]|uniref:helix-turn-helix domain-containing protein n=1 Tax=Dactylosporangium sp. CA-092794 TaxID=3239929 RepID=UPI003D8FB40A